MMRPQKRENLNFWKVCCKTNRHRGPIREIRTIEFLLCVICLLVILLKHLDSFVRVEFYLVTIGVVVSYTSVTFLDIVVVYTRWPVGWSIFSLFGSLFFFSCLGLSFLLEDALAYTVLSAITATVFFLDGLCTLKLNRNVTPSPRDVQPRLTPAPPKRMKNAARYSKEQKLKPRFQPVMTSKASALAGGHAYERNNAYGGRKHRATSSEEGQDSRSSKRETNTTDESASGKEEDSQGERNDEGRRLRKIRNRPTGMILAKAKVSHKSLQARRSTRRMQEARRENLMKTVATSYGGTFHMSRDTAPMACPFVNPEEVPQNEKFEEQDSRKCHRMVQLGTHAIDLTPLRLPFSTTKYGSPSPRRNEFDLRSNSAIN